jgi:hypothetical protein
MRKLLLHVWAFLCLFPSLTSAQPGNLSYVPGTQVCWNFNGRDHGYFRAAGNGERHILVSFTGIGENHCGEINNNSPQKLLQDNGINWNGRTVRAPGDTIVWEVFTLFLSNIDSFYVPPYAADIAYFIQQTGMDTSNHARFHIEGLSAGARMIWRYLTNENNHNSPYRHIFSTTITMSVPLLSNAAKPKVTAASIGKRHWVWHGLFDNHSSGCCPARSADTLYKYLSGSKIRTIQSNSGAGHNDNTWDSCMSLAGSDTNTNRWKWMVTNGPVVQPPVSWGPPNYVPGTQVCWTFNGRPHGYFRAAGNGERHILVSFTTDNEDTCTNLATNAPQKWLPAQWNGKTVRAPGDTIIWEIFTIGNTNNYSLGAYISDINYFFSHIESIDTSMHRRFHIESKAGGTKRMWGYLVNAQGTSNNHYRNIFGTTITQSTGYFGSSGLLPLIRQYSPGKKHWVWRGASDATAPAAASQQLYDSLQGTKTLTSQVGGTAGASTWDSCLSRSGTTITTNRWLWMANSTGILRMTNPVATAADRSNQVMPIGVYPNPARNSVMVTPGFAGDPYRITVTDAMGRVYKVVNNIRHANYTLDVSTLKTGVYIIQVSNGKERIQKKLIKE